MGLKKNYQDKFEQIAEHTLFPRLGGAQQHVVRNLAECYRFTLQELRQVSEIALDLEMWGEGGLDKHLAVFAGSPSDSLSKQRLLNRINLRRENLRAAPNGYSRQTERFVERDTVKVLFREKPQLSLGYCPVASPKTRCCNLLTLDAVENCGYQCSYCSIQSFYTGNQVFFDPAFTEKLQSLELDPGRTYHIGTGQSSDSLMWGNSNGVLDSLIGFAQQHSNVILELKTKSANVGHLLKHDLPANLLCTWSLNPQTIIDHEERGAASLQERLGAARQIAESGSLVGFHFHPMIQYQDWKQDYAHLFESVQGMFSPEQVVMVSIGTLTFIKPVMRRIRESGIKSQILKQQLVDAEGKLSYPDEIKLALFSFAYSSFRESWKRSVFFYLCMESHKYWKPVFGFEYPSNERLEEAMQDSYMGKIGRLRESRQ